MINEEEVTVIMGNVNAKVDKGRVEKVIGGHGLENRNVRGDRLI